MSSNASHLNVDPAHSPVGNADYLEQLYEQWKQSPGSLSAGWQAFFSGFDLATCPRACVAAERARAQSQIDELIRAYRVRGHLRARLDPLGSSPPGHPELELGRFGFGPTDLERVFDCGLLACANRRATLRDIIALLDATYCRHVGVEYMHIQDPAVRRWLQEQMEPVRNQPPVARDQQRGILEQLTHAERFERFLQRHYPGQKRFSLEGAETLIAALHSFVELATELGVREIVIGMAHRGRLSVLANILDKSYAAIFAEFEGEAAPDRPGGDGDVRYHKGYASEHDGRIRLSLTSNPSHLEAVDPVLEGRARAKQRRYGDTSERTKVVPLLIHGDAAFSGQGLVAETLNLSQLEGYRTGGTVHFVVNNQIGFTANPAEARSSIYPTDVLKMVEAPIFHVNGDEPEAVVWATELALRFRQTFHRDVGVDMVCYRRHGHSEVDEPSYTQPVMYRRIAEHPSVRARYQASLLSAGVLSAEEDAAMTARFDAKASEELTRIGQLEAQAELDPFREHWEGIGDAWSSEPVTTAVDHARLCEVAEALHRIPEGFHVNPKLARQLSKRLETVRGGGNVDWGLGEALALGTLLREGTPVRLSGQDSPRGTFSHRHAIWYDFETGEPHEPFNHLAPDQAHLCAYNSSLTEAAVLGFDYGYSLVAPEMLIVWEAQFGDFANGAQVIIDQFIVSSQAKWGRTSGLVMLLPHGYEGQGPEHSNAYLERYLAACAEDNIQVCNLTTPAQLFHALRRQQKRAFRRPLIVMSPKSLLRHPQAVSPLAELSTGAFHELLDDPSPPAKVRRVVLCTGKLFYELAARRQQLGASETALVRVEQLYPFAGQALRELLGRYPADAELVWAQEEPQNRGAFRFLQATLALELPARPIRYVGRRAAASPATGSARLHQREQQRLVSEAIVG